MKVKNMIKKIIAQNSITKSFKKNKGPHIILIGSPIHGNLGDHAISIAEEKWFNQIPDKKLIEIPGVYYELAKDFIRKKVNDNDIIVITGGGFIGTLWPNEQDMVNSIIANYCNNRIIIMPQTFYFSDSEEGSKELQKMQKLVEQHNDIHIFLREENSYKFCKKYFSSASTISLVPDMVISLNYMKSISNRKGVLLCFRDDKEKAVSNLALNKLYDKLNEYNLSINKTDTVINHRIDLKKRNVYFLKKLLEFQQSKLVITDRLHGMLFAAITGTPCIAVDNFSHKVKGVYKWLKPLKYIIFVDKFDQISKVIEKVLECKNKNYDLNIKYHNDFQKIIKIINN